LPLWRLLSGRWHLANHVNDDAGAFVDPVRISKWLSTVATILTEYPTKQLERSGQRGNGGGPRGNLSAERHNEKTGRRMFLRGSTTSRQHSTPI
jgi:hypothetical protein